MWADHDAPRSSIDRNHKVRGSHRDPDTFALTDRKAFDTWVMTDHLAVARYDFTRSVHWTLLPNELRMQPGGDKADFLAVAFVSYPHPQLTS